MAENTPNANDGAAGKSQGAGEGDLDQGQGTGGAPKAPAAIPAKKPEGFDETSEGAPAGDGKKPAGEAPKQPETPPAAEPPAAEEPEKGSEAWHKQFVQTGNEHADSAIELMKESGVSPIEANAVFQKAIESGKLEDIQWDMLEGKIGKGKTALVKAGVETFYNNEYKGRLETVNKAYELVGGEANWNTIRTWAQTTEKSDPAFKSKVDSLRAAINVGGFAAEMAVKELKGMYEGAPGTKGLGTAKITQGTRTAAAESGSPLSRSDYMAERHKLAQQGVGDADPRIRALFARRKAGQQAGI